jgi:putative FmdB family regulatory protein
VPIYEYLCEGCGRISEVMQKISDPAPRICPECGSRKIAKLVSRTAFQLKGGGWYSDLYASAKKDVKAGEAKATSDAPGGKLSPPEKSGPATKAGAAGEGAATAAPAKKASGSSQS